METPFVLKSALLSVYRKEGLSPVLEALARLGVQLYASGGTHAFIQEAGHPVTDVAELTTYPAILGGRVKTLHPAVFGGILAKRADETHQAEVVQYQLPLFDLVVVDLYPFQQTLLETSDEAELTEKIDIGGVALIRAAAKNFQHVCVLPDADGYSELARVLNETNGHIPLETRRRFAARAFRLTAAYDALIENWLNPTANTPLRYGENPHQSAVFEGNLADFAEKLNGKALSYNNLLDMDAAYRLLRDFRNQPTVAIFKHTNPCGIASRADALEAWQAALACDPVSAFGGIVVTNHVVTEPVAQAIDGHFYEILIARDYTPAALTLLAQKPNRILLKYTRLDLPLEVSRSTLTGKLVQLSDSTVTSPTDYRAVTERQPTAAELADLAFAERAAKHLKSNAIALVKNQQLIGSGVGQTSRIDALQQCLDKAQRLGFDPKGAVLASDGFFPFADSVQTAHQAGVAAILQPGGSKRDQDSIDYCNQHGLAMVFTGQRHFRH